MSPQHLARDKSTSPIRRWPRRVLVTSNVIVALALVATGSAFGYVQFRLGQIKRVFIPGLAVQGSSARGSQSRTDGTPVAPFTMLFIGSDTRALPQGPSAQFGSQALDPGQRSDSIILVRVVPATRSLALFSIPRDTLTEVPGYGTTRINTAFNNGPALLVQVLDQDFGIQVNHVAQFNFATFQDIATAIGGVYQWFPGPAKDAFSGLNITQAGCVLLSGDQALAFARSREYQYSTDGGRTFPYQQFPESDLGRIQRQQAFVKLAAKKIKQIAPTNPATLNSLISSLTKDVSLDNAFSTSLILSLAKDFRSADLSNIPSYTYPTVNSTQVTGALDPLKALGQQEIQQWLSAGQPPPPTPAAIPTTSTSTSATTVPTPPGTVVAPSSVAVLVINGSGAAGQAGLAGSDLRTLGYRATVSAVTKLGHARTTIAYAPDALAAAKQLQRSLKSGAVLTEDATLTPTVYNLALFTGQDYTGATGVVAPAATTTTAPAPTTTLAPQSGAAFVGTATVEADSSSFYNGQYVPPGREPGQIPQTCPS